MTEREKWKNKGFEEDQIAEIISGIDAGIDVSRYADKKYLAIQMRQIRLGVMAYLPVENYADVRYDWFQMEEIRKGLRDHVDIHVYASPEIPYEKMRQIRKGLRAGINLSKFSSMKADILEQLRLAYEEHIDLSKYISEGYDAKQLYEIRLAIKDELDMDSYLTREYIGPSLAEIRKGLKSGVDVSVYAKPEYGWNQMRELRLGMEKQVDISKYNNSLYSWRQMKEIRLGLEQGLHVESYGRLRFTSQEMHRRRMKMLGHTEKHQPVMEKNLIKAADIEVEITVNGMEAYVKKIAKDRAVTKERLLDILKRYNIRAGILDDALEEIIKGETIKKPVLVARGQIPKKGADGWYECFFRTTLNRRPKILKDGSADFKNVEWFETVKAGQKLVYYHPAEAGTDGYTVSGKPIPAQKGMEKSILTGKGFVMEADKKTYTSTVDGMVSMNDTTLEVTRHMEVEDVTIATGDIYFDGSLHIKGNVENGTLVKVTEDLEIDGNVGAATILCGGNVLLKKGMNAAGHGLLKAEKGVVSRFFEAVKVEAKEDIQVNKCLNSQLYAGGMIISSSIIAGGVSCAEKGFRITNAGNGAGLHTALKIGFNEQIQEELNRINTKIVEAEQELRMLQNSYMDYLAKFPPEIRNGMELFLKLEKAVSIKKQQISDLKAAVDAHFKKMNEAKVMIGGRAYEGCVVEINRRRWKAENQFNIVLKSSDDEIVILNT